MVAVVMPRPPETVEFVIGTLLGMFIVLGIASVPSAPDASGGSDPEPAPESYGPYQSLANGKLWTRAEPRTDAEIVGEIDPDEPIYAACWTYGETVSSVMRTSSEWLKVASPEGGYASAAFVTYDGRDVPQC